MKTLQLFDGDGPVRLSDLQHGDHADCFGLLASKDRRQTRDGKPYFRVTFRDKERSVASMVWSDSPWFADCEGTWQEGRFYKIRCRYEDSDYGPQIEVEKIREVVEEDREQGFDPADFYVTSRFDVEEMFAELVRLAEERITEAPLRALTVGILTDNAEALKRLAAASRNHHAFTGGFVEHVLSVTRTAVYFADKYAEYYPRMRPPLSKSLVVAGAILHDIGKLRELQTRPEASEYTPEGRLIGHILLGRDIVREKAAEIAELDADTLLRLEHVVVSHQNLPEWGSPIAPHTPEALLVHYADDVDAKFHMLATALEREPEEGEAFTDRSNALRRGVFRGLPGAESDTFRDG